MREPETEEIEQEIKEIDHLGYVEFQYITEDGIESLYVSEEEASEMAGKDIKKCAETPSELSMLLEKV